MNLSPLEIIGAIIEGSLKGLCFFITLISIIILLVKGCVWVVNADDHIHERYGPGFRNVGYSMPGVDMPLDASQVEWEIKYG